MVACGGTINFSRKCHNIKLSMGEYVLNSPMLSIRMVGADVVPRVQWLQSLGTIDFNFQEHFMKFSTDGNEFELCGITGKLRNIISSNGIKKSSKKGTTRCNCTTMFARGSHIKIIHFSRSPKSLGKSFQGICDSQRSPTYS